MFHGDFIDLVDVLVDAEGKYKISPILNIVGFWDSLNQRFVGNRISLDTQEFTQTQTTTSTAATTFTVPTGEVWELTECFCSLDTDGNAANRVLDITVTSHVIIALAAIGLIDLTGVTITANQVGGIYMNEAFAPNLWTNDNGTVAVVADENPLPLTLQAGAVISFNYTNDQAGDIIECQIRYRKKTPISED